VVPEKNAESALGAFSILFYSTTFIPLSIAPIDKKLLLRASLLVQSVHSPMVVRQTEHWSTSVPSAEHHREAFTEGALTGQATL
jgi:hypothetical protein